MALTDLYDYVAERFIRNFERGFSSWISPWCGSCAGGLPLRANGRPFRGVNVPILWDAAQKRKLSSSLWLTSREVGVLGGRARKGAHPTTLVTVDKLAAGTGPYGEPFREVTYLRPFNVMNLDEVRGLDRLLPIGQPDAGRSSATVTERATAFFATAQAALRIEAGSSVDPVPESAVNPVAAQKHLALWAQFLVEGAAQRGTLVRSFDRAASGPLHDIRRELALRLSAEFLCADLNIVSRDLPKSDFPAHAWMALLEENRRAVFECASYAQKSLDYLRSIAPR